MKQFYGVRVSGLILTLAQIIELEKGGLSIFQDKGSICVGYILEKGTEKEVLSDWDTSLIRIILKESHDQVLAQIEKILMTSPKNVVVGNFNL